MLPVGGLSFYSPSDVRDRYRSASSENSRPTNPSTENSFYQNKQSDLDAWLSLLKGGIPTALGLAGILAIAIGRKSIRTVSRPALVLVEENWQASKREGLLQLQEVPLRNLIAGARKLLGRYVHVRGEKACDPRQLHPPFVGRRKSPSDAFVQVNCYRYMDRMCRVLKHLGYDFEAIQASIHGGRYHPIRVLVNTTRVKNAKFSNRLDVHIFGRNVGLDGDVVVHEGMHGVWFHINPLLTRAGFSKETAAIHEGTSDAFAAILHGNPIFGEDCAAIMGGHPSPYSGLRNLRNKLKLNDTLTESHDRGEVYGSFFWSLFEKLRGDDRLAKHEATELSLRLIVNHWFHYKTMHPTSVDFIDAILSGAKALERDHKMPLPLDDLKKMILDESVRRKLIPPEGGRTVFTVPGMMAEQVRERYAKSPVRFRKVGGAPYLGGRTEIYQQQVVLQKLRTEEGVPLKVDVVGHGFFAWHTDEGIEAALQDIRPLERGTIIEKVNLTPQQALDLLEKRLGREIRLAETKLNLLQGWRRDEESKRQLLLKRAKESIREKDQEVEMSLVAMRGKRRLYYEIQVSGGTHYIAAYVRGTRKPLHYKMVFSASGKVEVAA